MKLMMSIEGGCLAEKEVAKMARLPKQKASVFVVNAKPAVRYVSLVEVGDTPYWADRATGSLYHTATGQCLTSSNLRLDVSTLE